MNIICVNIIAGHFQETLSDNTVFESILAVT